MPNPSDDRHSAGGSPPGRAVFVIMIGFWRGSGFFLADLFEGGGVGCQVWVVDLAVKVDHLFQFGDGCVEGPVGSVDHGDVEAGDGLAAAVAGIGVEGECRLVGGECSLR